MGMRPGGYMAAGIAVRFVREAGGRLMVFVVLGWWR